MSILSVARKESAARGIVELPFLIERQCASIGCHLANLSNLDNKRFYHMGSLQDLREHVIVMSPSGYGKTLGIKFFLKPLSGLMHGIEDIPIATMTTFTPESWAGTTIKTGNDGKIELTKGIFKKYKRGIIGADEFMRLKTLTEHEVSSNEEAFILDALSNDTAIKYTAVAPIPIMDIGTTIWPGMRLCRLDTRSGLLRRFSFQLIFPTLTIAKKFKYATRSKESKSAISQAGRDEFMLEVEKARLKLSEVSDINYTEVEEFVNGSFGVPHFEEAIFKRLALGYSVVSGDFPDIKMTGGLIALLRNEYWARDVVRDNPEKEAMHHIVLNETERLTQSMLFEFMRKYYQMSINRVKSLWHDLKIDKLVYIHNGEVKGCPRDDPFEF